MNIVTFDGDRYMSVLPPSDVIRTLMTDMYDRGYDKWDSCVVKDPRRYLSGRDADGRSVFQLGSITWAYNENDHYNMGWNTKRHAVHLDLYETFYYRPTLVPLDSKGRKLLDPPVNPDWLETEGGSAYIDRKLVNLEVLELRKWVYEYSRLDGDNHFSIRNTHPDQPPLRWVWMSGYMVCVNFEVLVNRLFIENCRYIH